MVRKMHAWEVSAVRAASRGRRAPARRLGPARQPLRTGPVCPAGGHGSRQRQTPGARPAGRPGRCNRFCPSAGGQESSRRQAPCGRLDSLLSLARARTLLGGALGVGGRHKSRRGALGRLQHCWQLGARCRSPSRVSLRVSHQPIQVSLPVPAALRHPPSSCARLAVESPLAPDAGSRCGIRDARRLPAESELAGGGVGGLSASVHRAAAGARPFAWRQRPWGGKGGGNPSDARESVFRT